MTGRATSNRVRIERLPESQVGGPRWGKVYVGDENVFNGSMSACNLFVQGYRVGLKHGAMS